MNKFKVLLSKVVAEEVLVEADTEEDAERIALLEGGKVLETKQVECDVVNCEEVLS
jgi:hypothetical protein